MKKIALKAPLVLFVLIAVATACSVNPVTGKQEFNLISESMEIEMGKSTDASIREEYGLYNDPALANYVETLGKRMAPLTHRPNLPYHFAVLDTPVENAFAAPGGYIYLTRGMLAIMNDEAVLVSILGHELGHVNARHTARAMSRQLLLIGGLVIGSALSKDVEQLAPLAAVAMQLFFLKYSREDEYQADSLGVLYARRTGFAPGQIVPLFNTFLKMEEQAGGAKIPNFLSTHPLTASRIEAIKKMLEPADTALRVARNDYLARLDGLIYGENPRQGYVENSVFYHPELQCAFQLPQGWKYQNTPKQFLMAPADEKAATYLTAETTTKDPASMVQARAASFKDVRVSEIGRGSLRINGLDAYRGVYSVQSASQDAQAAPTTVDINCIRKGGQIFTFIGMSSSQDFKTYQGPIQNSVRSFRPLTDAGHLNRQPRRITLQSARSGETLRSILQSRNVDAKQWKAVELMNGVTADQPLQVNQRLKFFR